MTHRVLGVDGCKAGWIGVVLDRGRTSACHASTIFDLASAAEAAGELAVVAIDIPIGLPDAGRRCADIQARGLLGPRRSSVFITPVRPALEANDHASAVRVSQELTNDGISIQAFSLKQKILEVDAWVRSETRRVVEVHPEVSFAHMAGTPLLDSKITWAGAERRRDLLNEAGIKLAGHLGDAGRFARVDDVLDAAAAAWSARRVAAGEAVCLPDPPDMFSDGLTCAICSPHEFETVVEAVRPGFWAREHGCADDVGHEEVRGGPTIVLAGPQLPADRGPKRGPSTRSGSET